MYLLYAAALIKLASYLTLGP